MMNDNRLTSSKTHRDENFPVASALLKAEHRAPIMAFYHFARAADDIADHPTATCEEKRAQLGQMRAGLSGKGTMLVALDLGVVMTDRDLDPVHAHELLDAFEQDVAVRRYAIWDDLIAYCRLSAMPVGRFVLDVHGEDRATWPASDALCAALQIINHLQDCGDDYRSLDRVYLPTETLAAAGAYVEDLALPAAPPALLDVIRGLAVATGALLDQSAGFASQIRDLRLSAEVAIIQRLARDLNHRLETRDPLHDRVHHRGWEAALLAGRALVGHALRSVA